MTQAISARIFWQLDHCPPSKKLGFAQNLAVLKDLVTQRHQLQRISVLANVPSLSVASLMEIQATDVELVHCAADSTIDLAVEFMRIIVEAPAEKPVIYLVGNAASLIKLAGYLKTIGYYVVLIHKEETHQLADTIHLAVSEFASWTEVLAQVFSDEADDEKVVAKPEPVAPKVEEVKITKAKPVIEKVIETPSSENVALPSAKRSPENVPKKNMKRDDPAVFLPVLKSMYELTIRHNAAYLDPSTINTNIPTPITDLGFSKMKLLLEEMERHELIKQGKHAPNNAGYSKVALSMSGISQYLKHCVGDSVGDFQTILDKTQLSLQPLIWIILSNNAKDGRSTFAQIEKVLKPFVGPSSTIKYISKCMHDGIVTCSDKFFVPESVVQLKK